MTRLPRVRVTALGRAAPRRWPVPLDRALAGCLRRKSLARARLSPAARRALAQGRGTLSLLVAVRGAGSMRALNREFAGREGVPDVLAFPDGEVAPGRAGGVRLGEIAVSADRARREAAGRGLRAADEMLFLALHGMLHLLGGRDGSPRARARMHRDARDVLGALGFPPERLRRLLEP